MSPYFQFQYAWEASIKFLTPPNNTCALYLTGICTFRIMIQDQQMTNPYKLT